MSMYDYDDYVDYTTCPECGDKVGISCDDKGYFIECDCGRITSKNKRFDTIEEAIANFKDSDNDWDDDYDDDEDDCGNNLM